MFEQLFMFILVYIFFCALVYSIYTQYLDTYSIWDVKNRFGVNYHFVPEIIE